MEIPIAARPSDSGVTPVIRAALSVKGVCLNQAGEVLLCQNWRNEWELPGGRPEPGETFTDCLSRELTEEAGIAVEVRRALDAGGDLEVLPGRWVHIVAYGCRVTDDSAPAASSEHQHIGFFRPDALDDLALPEVYRRAIERWCAQAPAHGDDSATVAEHDQLASALAELCLALELADTADKLSMRHFQQPELAVRAKPDGSPVTDADVAVERALRDRLAAARPAHAIVGEESEAKAGSDGCWYLDPIDGTSRYVVGDPHWYTLIAATVGDTVTAAVASAPALGVRWWAARGAGAFCNGRRIAVSDTPSLAMAAVDDDWRGTLEKQVPDRPLSIIARKCALVRPHEGHSYLSVAQGHSDIAAGVGGGPWDYAAIKLIVEETGGRFTDLRGIDSFSNGSALVSNGALHQEALTELAGLAEAHRE